MGQLGTFGVVLTDHRRVELGGPLGTASQRAIKRLGDAPYTLEWLRADLSFERARRFTNFSGDVSGRFIEAASLTSPEGKQLPETLPLMLAAVGAYQRPEGYFGVHVDWRDTDQVMSAGTPILWGGTRMLVGLVTAYECFGDPAILAAAKRLGDFYVDSADTLCDPDREAEFLAAKNYYSGFDVCYAPAIESLARLYLLVSDARYLQVAERIAARFADWDRLPFPHAHGSFCAQYGRLLLREITGNEEYLQLVEDRWDQIVGAGYAWPNGGVGEKLDPESKRDEGCVEADWLRLNLRLWSDTGKARYLDEVERLLHNEYLANQFPTGGFGHRLLECDCNGLLAMRRRKHEATWCCSFHGALGYVYLKSYLATGGAEGIHLNFPVDFKATLEASGSEWAVCCEVVDNKPAESLMCRVIVKPAVAAASTRLLLRIPFWATGMDALLAGGEALPLEPERDGVVATRVLTGATELRILFKKHLRIEDRNRHLVPVPNADFAVLRDIVLCDGPDVLYADVAEGRPTLLAMRDAFGNLVLPSDGAGHFLPSSLASEPADPASLNALRATAKSLEIGPWLSLPESDRKVFVFTLVIIPCSAMGS